MSRTTSWMRWATCALAISVTVPAIATAERVHKSLADCTGFEQADKGDDAVSFTIHNGCSIPVDCSIHWRLVCAPESKKRRSTHPATARLALGDNGTSTADASAGDCGDDSWTIDQIEWSCQPNKD